MIHNMFNKDRTFKVDIHKHKQVVWKALDGRGVEKMDVPILSSVWEKCL